MAEDDPFERDHAPPIGVAERAGARAARRHRAEPRADDLHRHPQLRRRRGRGGGDRPRPRRSRPPRGARRGGRGRAGGGGARHPRPPRPQRRAPAPSRRGSGRRCWRGGRSAVAPAPAFAAGGGEGRDAGFRPDEAIGEGRVVAGPGWTLTALETPGHTADHLAFAWAEGARALLRRPRHGLGDDADLAARRRARRLPREPAAAAGPAGDGLLSRPRRAGRAIRSAIVAHILAHRDAARGRRSSRRSRAGRRRSPELVAALYADVDPRLHGAAARNVLAHLIDLEARGLVVADGERFALAAPS